MTPNKLPPLPEPNITSGNHRLFPESGRVHTGYSVEQMEAYAIIAAIQSQSLPAGAVADEESRIDAALSANMNGYLVPDLLRGDDECQRAGMRVAIRAAQALQADAREKGEDSSLVLVPREPTEAMWTAMITASIEAEEVYDGQRHADVFERFGKRRDRIIHQYRAAINAALATQPAQASEKSTERGVSLTWRPLLQWAIGTIDELNGGPMTAADWDEDSGLYQLARNLAFNEATHPQPVTPAGGEVEPYFPVPVYMVSTLQSDGDCTVNVEEIAAEDYYTADQLRAYREARPPVADAALDEAYKQGWLVCTNWASRDDLVSDIDSPAYIKARDISLAALNQRGGGA